MKKIIAAAADINVIRLLSFLLSSFLTHFSNVDIITTIKVPIIGIPKIGQEVENK